MAVCPESGADAGSGVERAEDVLKPGVVRPGIHQIGRAQLLDAAQTLHFGGVEYACFVRVEPDVTVDRIADEHGTRPHSDGETVPPRRNLILPSSVISCHPMRVP